jgi:PPOX class probable F420-dependent enzyme
MIEDARIFARGRLDPATAMLAEVFEIPRGAAVLDLGSGSGILGLLAARLEPTCHATLVDSDPLAVRASRRNAELNGIANVTVHLSDVLNAIPEQTFDVVLMNPPFHRGRRHDTGLAERFMRDASRALRPGGTLYVVCNRFLRYEPILQQAVGSVREVTGDRRFKVLWARRPAIARGRDDPSRRGRSEEGMSDAAGTESSGNTGGATGGPLIGAELRDFLAGAWICRLATLGADGYPQATPLWFEYDGEGYVFIGRERAEWVRQIRHDPRVGLCIDDPDGSHRRVAVQGRAEIVEGPSVRGPWLPIARRMAERYMGGPDGIQYMERTLDYPRVTVRVTPERTTTWRGPWARKYYQ